MFSGKVVVFLPPATQGVYWVYCCSFVHYALQGMPLCALHAVTSLSAPFASCRAGCCMQRRECSLLTHISIGRASPAATTRGNPLVLRPTHRKLKPACCIKIMGMMFLLQANLQTQRTWCLYVRVTSYRNITQKQSAKQTDVVDLHLFFSESLSKGMWVMQAMLTACSCSCLRC